MLRVLAELGGAYRQGFLHGSWARHRGCESDRWKGLGLFLEYAFERQGRRPDFSPAAVDTVSELSAEGLSIESPGAARLAWQRFCERLSNKGLNPANSPMAPKGTRYMRDGKPFETSQPSAVEVGAEVDRSLVAKTRELLATGRTRTAYDLITSINGVGGKIASLFLRDIASYYQLKVTADAELLQPVDVWVRRATSFILGLSVDPNTPAQLVASAITSACREEQLNPEDVNQGMWYFGAMVAKSEYRLGRATEDPEYLRRLLDEELNQQQRIASAMGAWIEQRRRQLHPR